MDIQKSWEHALKGTEIVRTRVQDLLTFADTCVPYILLCESSINVGDTVVRKGEVLVQKPSIVLPPNLPQFQGFEFEGETDFNREAVTNFLLVRGVALPSLKYDNKTHSLDVREDKLSKAVEYYRTSLQEREDVHTGLIIGPEDAWQFSVLIFICSQVARNAQTDITRLLKEFKKNDQ